MQKLFTTIKNATKSLAQGLFTSKSTQAAENNQEPTPEETKQEFEYFIRKYLDSDKELKIRILTNRTNFNKLVVELSWKKILDLKNIYAKERRINFQPRLVVLEQQHYERVIVQVAELIEAHYDIQIYYDKNELTKMVYSLINYFQTRSKVIEEQCTKILFSKEELKDYFEFFQNTQQILQKFQSQFSILYREYSEYYIKEIKRQFLIDQAFEIFQFDDCDENKAIKLFQDDKEVMQWYNKKQAKVLII